MELDKYGTQFPAKWSICDRCRGNGTHGNPAFDGMPVVITPDYDIDFWDDLRAGHYDVRCSECNGTGKVKTLDEDRATPDQIREYNEILEEDYRYQQEVAAEQRYLGYY